MSDDFKYIIETNHPNPVLRPTIETRCPLCQAEAIYWKPDYSDGTYVEAFDCECQFTTPGSAYSQALSRHKHLFRTRWKMYKRLARDYREMALRDYEVSPENLDVLDEMSAFGEQGQIFLHGAGGRGKSHLAIKTAVQLFSRGVTVEYWPETAFFEDAREYAMSDYAYKTKPGREGAVLILDDLGKTRPTPYAAQMLYDVLEFRVANKLGLIITSNHPPKEAAERMVLDGRNAGAVESRLISGRVLELAGLDRRAGSR